MIKQQVIVKNLELATFFNIQVMVKIKICQFPSLGAKIHDAELMPRPRHASSHVNDTKKMTLDLGAKAIDAETCKLDVNYHGAKVRVYFLKGYCQGCICENLLKKGLKNKKFGRMGEEGRMRSVGTSQVPLCSLRCSV